jgi:hypothetical protein
MKLPALILAGSLAANAALVVVYLNRSHPPTESDQAHTNDAATSKSASVKTGPTVAGSESKIAAAPAADPKTWARLNPGDLHALVARLRAAGFPPATIRAIVAAQVADQIRPKFIEASANTEIPPFWATTSIGNFGADPKALAILRDLGRESNRLIKEALGPDFPDDDPDTKRYQKNRYGDLPREKIDQLQRITEDYDDLRMQTTQAARGLMLPEDREKLALLDKEKRADLAKLLTPQEMEDYVMRTSLTTAMLRTALTAFDASETEFRAIFQAKQAFDDKYSYQNMGSFLGADAMKERNAAQQQMGEQLKTALGEQRYADYVRSSDREFQSISRLAQQANLPATAALQVYDTRTQASTESNRIFADTSLNTDQKRAALQALAQTTRAQITAGLGTEAGGTYLKIAGWISNIERGGAVSFNDGGGTNTRYLPQARPAIPTAPTTTTVVTPKTGG